MTRAHGGVLFIDEIGEMDPLLQTRLLKVLEDKRVTFESSYYDENAPNVPAYVKRLFREGAPADFILIGATTRDPEDIDPAIRSRCAEIFFAPLTQASSRLDRAGRDQAPGREGRARRSAADRVVHDRRAQGGADRRRRLRSGALSRRSRRRSETRRIRRSPKTTCAPSCRRAGSCRTRWCARARRARSARRSAWACTTISAASSKSKRSRFPASQAGKGTIRFNDTAGSMAKDSVFNATSVLRAQAGIDVADFDLHINVVGGGNIDGPSAGLAIFLALYSAIDEDAVAARRCDHRRALDPRQSARRRRRRRETLCGAAGRHARDAACRRRMRAKSNAALSGVARRSPVASVEQALRALRVHKLSTKRRSFARSFTGDASRRPRDVMSVSHLTAVPIDRIPPHNLEAEMALLGSVLVDREIMATVGEIVRPADFYAHVHETIFAVLYDLFDRGEPLDKISVAEELRTRDALEKRRRPLVSQLADGHRADGGARRNTMRRSCARKRCCARSFTPARRSRSSATKAKKTSPRRSIAPSRWSTRSASGTMHGEFMPVNSLMKDAFEHIDRLFHMRGDRTGVTSGFRDIDDDDDGLPARQLRDRRGAPGHGQDVVRAQHGGCGGARGEASRSRSSRWKCRTTS